MLSDSGRKKVLLLGGFNGYWNFGDILQLRGAINWWQGFQQDHRIISACDLAAITCQSDLDRLHSVYGVKNWVVYSAGHNQELNTRAREMGLESFEWSGAGVPLILHLYGGGFINGFWGKTLISLTESVFRSAPIGAYLISGQQVSKEAADYFAAHCRRYQPALIGCRDHLSVRYLKERGVTASWSGDDAFDELYGLASERETGNRHTGSVRRFGLHLNTSTYTWQNKASDDTAQATEQSPADMMDEYFRLLLEHAGGEMAPLLISAYLDSRDEVIDTWHSIKNTLFTQYFPVFTGIDLAGLLINGNPGSAAGQLRGLNFAISNSYHVALFLRILRVPVYLSGFNSYYRQKQSGLGQPPISLEEFLTDLPRSLADQEKAVTEHLAGRKVWLKKFAGTAADLVSNLEDRKKSFGQDDVTGSPDPAWHSTAWSGEPESDWREEADQNDQQNWIAELERGKAWLEAQVANWQKAAEEGRNLVAEQKAWIAELQDGKSWLERQWVEAGQLAEARLEIIRQQQALIAELESGKAWLEEQRSGWQAETEKARAVIAEQKAWIAELERGKAWLEEQCANWPRPQEQK
ncbi:MAG TPA: polysaccharide pyruvyl transferase family protein [Blastocatellia bacterium]|nr:polysaccharide pyruvyl transferase family protein [Blastocatellia bacterium]